ncbi:putative serpin-like protein TK1782 [Caerostris extrusa]|uniref:Serpin-like protein TK1782 n=1 Tax=Caerostris extrusa TaxID=172846 RepID=A0AAV4SQ01_CAEEX|nr:putative serpin-like protein TK1782 [Caerostris extrusa]
MMHLKEKFPYVEKETFKSTSASIQRERHIYDNLVAQCQRDGLEGLEKFWSVNFVRDLTQSMIKTKIQVALPKFRLEYSKSLKESFQTLGMNRVFNEGVT